MLFVPLSFCATLLLLVLLVRMARSGAGDLRERLFQGLVALYALQTLLVGLRWGYQVRMVLPVMPLAASLIPPASYLAFRALTREDAVLSRRDLVHLLPTLMLAVLMVVQRDPIDLLIILEFLGYGGAVLWLTRHGADGLVASRLDGSFRSLRAMQLCAAVLLASAASDVVISLDLSLSGGRHAGEVISVTTTLVLMLLGLAAAMAGPAQAADAEDGMADGAGAVPADGHCGPAPATGDRETPDPAAQAEWEAIAADLDGLMVRARLYTDTELNLARLARRLGRPARAVSSAVNRVHGLSVSQYVNDCRVAEACRLLAGTETSVTSILYEAGFMTKSNFNREFLRVTGMTPTAWRAARLRRKGDLVLAADDRPPARPPGHARAS